MPARVASAVDWDLERSTTSKPFRAAHSAMPDPMIPDPTMPRREIDMGAMLPVSSSRAPWLRTRTTSAGPPAL